jgi:hypothetical protein
LGLLIHTFLAVSPPKIPELVDVLIPKAMVPVGLIFFILLTLFLEITFDLLEELGA